MRYLKTTLALAGFALAILGGENARAADEWHTDYATALAQAKKERKPMLLDFTGSDWCPPCMLMKKRVFGSDEFKKFAKENLVLVELDFPQDQDANADLIRKNLALAEHFGISNPMTGSPVFPTLVLVRPDGTPFGIQQGAFFEPAQFLDWANSELKKAG